MYIYKTKHGFVFSSSPHGFGRYWLEGGPCKTIDGLYKAYGLKPVFQLIPCKGEFKAEVEFRTRDEERAFWLAMAHTGGIGALTNRQQGYRAVDDTPAEGPIPTPESRPADGEELVLASLRGALPELMPLVKQKSLRLNFRKPDEMRTIDDELKATDSKIRWWVQVCDDHLNHLKPLVGRGDPYPLILEEDGAIGETRCTFCKHPGDLTFLLEAIREATGRKIQQMQKLLEDLPNPK